MKGKIFLGILLLFSLHLTAQSVGSINYKVQLLDSLFDKGALEEDKTGTLAMANDALKLHVNKFNFKLNFRDNEASFKVEKQMLPDNETFKFKMVKILLNYDSEFYLNSDTKIRLHQLNAFGQNFIVQDSISNIEWQLKKDVKFIKNYSCYKAITTKVTINSQGTFYKDIIAWYCPELSYSFGPNGYGGLPGLILELQEDTLVFYASEIVLSKNEKMKIKKPTKGQLISKQEFDAKIINTDMSFGKN